MCDSVLQVLIVGVVCFSDFIGLVITSYYLVDVWGELVLLRIWILADSVGFV